MNQGLTASWCSDCFSTVNALTASDIALANNSVDALMSCQANYCLLMSPVPRRLNSVLEEQEVFIQLVDRVYVQFTETQFAETQFAESEGQWLAI